MATIKCGQCGYENPEGSTICEICAEELLQTVKQEPVAQSVIVQNVNTVVVPTQVSTASQIEDDGNEYFVLCPESHTKTIVPNGKVTSFFCEGCKIQHDIDGFLWNIESRAKGDAPMGKGTPQTQNVSTGDALWLEEVNSHFRIDIEKSGGTLGRYGKYGSEFFQSRSLLMVSGEHCVISYEFGNWVLRHISRTNQTKYNNMILGMNEPNLLEDGKMLTLANAVTFVVRIG